MIIARVVGNVVSTEKHLHYKGHKILVVQPIAPDGQPRGSTFLAVDGVQAGVGDTVLVVDEGGSARLVVGEEGAVTIRTAICGIVDSVDLAGGEAGGKAAAGGAENMAPAADIRKRRRS